MRKERLSQWILIFFIFNIFFCINQIQSNTLPYEEREEVKVFCNTEFKDRIKNVVEESKKYRVSFLDNEKGADFVLSDTIGKGDEKYSKVGWSPLIIIFSSEKSKNYSNAGYVSKCSDGVYDTDFLKIIEDTINGTWKAKIYCPKLDTMEGKLYKQFLIITVNNGKYPTTQTEYDACNEKVEKFLNADVIVKTDVVEWYNNKRKLEDEICIFFENDLISCNTDNTENIKLGYPNNTIVHEWYYSYPTNNEKLKEMLSKQKLLEQGDRIEYILYKYQIRNNYHKDAYGYSNLGFSNVEIPLESESFIDEEE